jgi:hypothetical protein
MTINDLIPQATETLVRFLRGKNLRVEAKDFDPNKLRAYYSCACLPEHELEQGADWINAVYFDMMSHPVWRGAELENWTDVVVCVRVERVNENDCIVFNLIDRASFEQAET